MKPTIPFRVSSLCSAVLYAAAALPAQFDGVGPVPLRQPQPVPFLYASVFNAYQVASFYVAPASAGTSYIAAATRQSRTGPSRLCAWDFDWSTLTATRRADFDAVTQDNDDDVFVDSSALHCAFNRTGKVWAGLRSKRSDPWTVGQVTGLPNNNPYGAAVFKFDGQLAISCLTPAPNATQRIYAYNAPAFAAGALLDTYQLASAIEYFQAAAPVTDAFGEARAWWFLNRQSSVNQVQRVYRVSNVRAASSPARNAYDVPAGNMLSDLCAFGGGFLAPVVTAGPGPLTPEINEFQYVTANDVALSALGGPVTASALLPPTPGTANATGFCVLGLLGTGPIVLSFLGGSPMGLDPATLVVMPPVSFSSATGYGELPLQTPPLPAATRFFSQWILPSVKSSALTNTTIWYVK